MKKLIQIGLCLLICVISYTQTTSSFVDTRDGQSYKIVKIGNQLWMAENLAYLPAVSPSYLPIKPLTFEFIAKPYYYVNGYSGGNVGEAKSTSNYATYGVLYNWPAAMNGAASSINNPSGVQGVCPSGWHLPSDAEWTELIVFLGGKKVAGGKLKEIGNEHWHTPNEGGTNESGFKALPGGCRKDYLMEGPNVKFQDIGWCGYWWSATEYGDEFAQRRLVYNNLANMIRYLPCAKEAGFSVRCVKD